MSDDRFPSKKKQRLAEVQTPAPETHRMLPANADAEQGVLCSILLAPDEILRVAEDRGATDDWFHTPAHRILWDLLVSIWKSKLPIDAVTVLEHARNLDKLTHIGGPEFLSQLYGFLPTAANAAYYLDILAEKHALRRLIVTATTFAGRAYDEQDNCGSLIDEFQAAALLVNRPDATGVEAIQHVKPAVFEAVKAIEETYHHRGGVVGLPTGYHQIDRMTGGLRGPKLIIIAGRPSMGKSALIWNIGEHLAIECGRPVLGFSLEMNTIELVSRMLCGRAGINLQRVRDGFLSKIQVETTLPNAVTKIASAPIYIDETPAISIQELRVRVRRFIRKHPNTAAILVDYLQLMRSTTKRAQDNRALELGEISGGLKSLAKEINRPIIAGAQLNRDNDGPNNLPKLSNLRESGSIEQDADDVFLIHRRHYYTKADEDKGKASVDLAKQRNGPTGTIALDFDQELGRFKNPAGQELYSNDPTHRQRTEDEADD